ncbi:MAG: helix-turn-helix domain-containing protein [Actinomycetota bacterium]|nr:helix-turn-helix domain-containing protein [Actinomycetota bacterium]
MDSPDESAGRFEWERIVRRAKIDPTAKYVGMVLATYANRDGTKAHPGRTRLAAVTGKSERTVDRALDLLRELGLLQRTTRGSSAGRQGLADVYRLTIPADLLARVDLLPPSEVEEAPDHPSSVSSGRPEQPSPTSSVLNGSPDTSDYHHSSSITDHSTLVTTSLVTHVNPPHQDHPYDQNKDQARPRRRARRCPSGAPYAFDGSCCGNPHDLSQVI